MKRTQSAAPRGGASSRAFLVGAAVALAAATGVAAVAAPGADHGTGATAAATKPVERSTLVCPQPSRSDVAETEYSAFTPKSAGTGGKGAAALYPAARADPDEAAGDSGGGKDDDKKNGKKDKDKKDKDGKGAADGAPNGKPTAELKSPGSPVTSSTDSSGAPALSGSAEGKFAPGWTVQQTTTVSAGVGRGLQGSACTEPDTDFYFPGVSTSDHREDYVHLTNPDDTGAVVDVDLYGTNGRINSEAGEGISVPPHSTVPVLLSTLTEQPADGVTAHVVARNGRVGAQVQASDKKEGGDWLRSAADSAPSAVLPGIPADASKVRLTVDAPGEQDADLKVRLAGKSGKITPAGHQTLRVKGGTSTSVDLRDLTKGEAGSLVLSPSGDGDATPVVAGAQVTRGKGNSKETGFIPATAPVAKRATAAGNSARGGELALTAPEKSGKVRVTASQGSDGGSPASKTYTVKGGTTQSFPPPRPQGGKGSYAVTVERLSGGPVYASRMLQKKQDGVPAFTVQTLPDDQGTVPVPQSAQDLSVLNEN